MADYTVQVIGIDNVRAACGAVSTGLETKAMALANKKAAETVARLATPMVPARSGRLRGSVRALATAKKGNVKAGSAAVPYAAAIHWGRKVGNVWHHKMGPNPIKGRPYLWDAKNAALSSGQLERDYKAAVDELIHNFF